MDSVARYQRKIAAVCAAFAIAATCFPLVAFADDEPQLAAEKSETVSVTTNANGEVEKLEVEAVLKNDASSERLLDATGLTDIKAEDKATYEPFEDDIAWRADGENITYKGTIDKQLPITMYVTYTLDGLIVNPSEIAGKAGDVTIRYDFTNEYWFTANVNGKDASMRMPFTCITALMLNGDSFTDVKVTNGKVISDGSDVIITGYAMPGLKTSLGPMAEKADVPEYIEISAKTTDFNLKSSMTIVTAGLMSDLDIEGMGFEDLNDMSSGLSDGISSLISGADSLTDGLKTLADGASSLDDGASTLAEGASTLSDGIYLLAYGEDGKSGLKGAAASSGELVSALEEIESSLNAVTDQKKGLPAAAGGLEQLAAALPDEQTLAALEAALAASNLDKNTLQAVIGILEGTKQVGVISAGVSEASSGVVQIADGYSLLVSQAGQLPEGLQAASDATEQLYTGASQLADGAWELADGTSELSEGVQVAADGSGELAQGLVEYDNEGIAKIVSTIDDDIGGFKKRLKILSNEASAYDTFSGKAYGTPSSVKFVYETPAIEAK